MTRLDAVIVGSGPNGLAAAITLARAGLKVQVLEAHDRVGGAMQSAALTLPGFTHDIGSAIHPLAVASPAFREWPLHAFGLEWVYPDAPAVHTLWPASTGSVTLERSLDATAEALGRDGLAWKALLKPLLADWEELLHDILRPLFRIPSSPVSLARFGLRGLPSAEFIGNTAFQTPEAKALWAGLAAHTTLPLSTPGTSAMTLVLTMVGHAVGYPFPRGGAQSLADAMTAYLKFLGGEVLTGVNVRKASDLPDARVVMVDSSPAVLLELLGERAPAAYRDALGHFKYGPGIQKFDYALDGPVPWLDERVRRSATVHIGGSFEEVVQSEAANTAFNSPRPYVLAAQHTLFDPTRAPAGKHTLWAYTHVPNGSEVDVRPQVEAQLERFAPGFKERVLACRVTTAPQLAAFSPVMVGGDVNGGAATLWQLLFRPHLAVTPYRTPVRGFYLCSSSTPPGGGVHGMAGYHAAKTVLHDEFDLHEARKR